MRLTNLTASSKELVLEGEDREVTGITADSREVAKGTLFAAIPGTAHDGRTFIPDAVARGATAVLVPADTDTATIAARGISVLKTADIRGAISTLAALFYPRQPAIIAAITGTSGKTSTTQFAREIWQNLAHKSASIGTLGLVTAKETRYGSLTTPDAITLHKLLNEVTGQSITHLAMEASSHGLALKRLDHVKVKIGAFTNLSHDHLDYHGTMEEYLAAKLRLFLHVLPEGAAAVLNADVPEFEVFSHAAQKRNQKIFSYGTHGKEIKLLSIAPDAKGQVLKLELLGNHRHVLLPLIGRFQAWNGLCALGIALASDEDPIRAASALGKVTGVPGRMQLVGQKNGATVFVDYAHKPDALENVLASLRPHVAARKGARLGVVFGCGGNRDKGKRPIMGSIAQRLADWVIVTDDNPRNENPATIRKEILASCKPGPNLREIGDRAMAIAAGIDQLGAGDVLVIAGKGHEPGQIIGDYTLPFDDADVARKALGA